MKMLKETEEKYKIGNCDRIKFVETAGVKYADHFKNSNPFRPTCEPEEKCLLCKTEGNSDDCKVSNIGYSIFCKKCKEKGRQVSYEGESSRNSFLRSVEHVRDLENKSKRSVLHKHVVNEHKEEEAEVKFGMKLVGKFSNSLSRIIDESRRIRNKSTKDLLNSKSEFHGPVIKRKIYEN